MFRIYLTYLTLFVFTGCNGSNDGGSQNSGTYPPISTHHPSPAEYGRTSFQSDQSNPPQDKGSYEAVGTNPFVEASHDPFSTFAADIDSASYEIFMRDVNQYDTLPAPESVRLEDYINYFDYQYAALAADSPVPFSIDLAAGVHPMGRNSSLLRVGIQAKAPPPFERKKANLVFLVDSSGSMNSSDKLPLVKTLLAETVRALEKSDVVSIVTYSGKVAVIRSASPVGDGKKLKAQIEQLYAEGSTNGEGGIQKAYEQASAGFIDNGINHVILCTDGDFNVGISDNDKLVDLIEEKRESGVTLTALGFGRNNLNDSMMERVSNAGNGIYSVIIDQDRAVDYAHHKLLRTAHHVAKDMKIQVEFNPAHVKAYRLLGYVNRAIRDDEFRNDSVDAGEVGAGYRVTALYEIVGTDQDIPTPKAAPEALAGDPVEGTRAIETGDMVTVRVRYKDVHAETTSEDTDKSKEVAQSIAPEQLGKHSSESNRELQWASAVAAFAEILQESPFANSEDLERIGSIVEKQKNRDSQRMEFSALFTKSKSLIETK